MTDGYNKLNTCGEGELTLEYAQTNFGLTLFKSTDGNELKHKMEHGEPIEKFWVVANENCKLDQAIVNLLRAVMGLKELGYKDIRIAAVRHPNANQFVLLLGMKDPDPEVREAAKKTFKEKFSTRNY